jgi:diguanylate cyclase (GGDEF)-like protein
MRQGEQTRDLTLKARFSATTAYWVFCVLSALALAAFLWHSYQRAWDLAESRLSFSSTLIAEWISSTFVASDYLLRDMAALVGETDAVAMPPGSPAHTTLSLKLDQRRATFPHALRYGVFDSDCVVTHGDAVLGSDASGRDYCSLLRQSPGPDSVVTNGFRSHSGPVNVTHARALRTAEGEFAGLVAITLDTTMFSEWLRRMGESGRVDTLAIIDRRDILLARFPPLPEAIGQWAGSAAMTSIWASEDRFHVVHMPSPLDGKPRSFGARKVEGLPFAIVVGVNKASWLNDWYRVLSLGLLGLVLIWLVASVALRNHQRLLQSRAQILQQAHTDALTGVPNREYFAELAQRELARARRAGRPVSLMMLDVDRFKSINDSHGHLVGDRALKAFAGACAEVTRADELLGRWGGDEFVVLAIQDTGAATRLAERLRAAIARTQLVDDHGQPVSLAATIGIASMDAVQVTDLGELTQRADAAMLAAKQAGRDRISVWGQDPVSTAPECA